MDASILIRENAIDTLLSHALRSAKAHGKEVLGWLMGFFQKDGVCVSESVPCTKYMHQSRFGAEADPTEEAEVASSYPRNVGIVGLYHSHPFAMRLERGVFRRISTLDDIFHSRIDDKMLKSRSSRRKNYISIVTNGIDFSCYVMKRGSEKVEPALVREIPYKNSLKSFRGNFIIDTVQSMGNVEVDDIIGIASRELMDRAKKELGKGGCSIEEGTVNRRYAKSRRRRTQAPKANILSIFKDNNHIRSEAHISLSSAVYTAGADEKEVDRAMKEEMLDNIAYLLWKLSTSEFSLKRRKWSSVEIHLGSIEIDESGPLPRKTFQMPERGITIKRS
jgi:hypothetical protein